MYKKKNANSLSKNTFHHKKLPLHLYCLAWKDGDNNHFEFWSNDFGEAMDKKYEIDHNHDLYFLSFDTWYGFRSNVYFEDVEKLIT